MVVFLLVVLVEGFEEFFLLVEDLEFDLVGDVVEEFLVAADEEDGCVGVAFLSVLVTWK